MHIAHGAVTTQVDTYTLYTVLQLHKSHVCQASTQCCDDTSHTMCHAVHSAVTTQVTHVHAVHSAVTTQAHTCTRCNKYSAVTTQVTCVHIVHSAVTTSRNTYTLCSVLELRTSHGNIARLAQCCDLDYRSHVHACTQGCDYRSHTHVHVVQYIVL